MQSHVVHIGDTHGRTDERSADQFTSLDAAIGVAERLAAAETLALIAWPGDLFHSVSDAATRNALQVRALQLAELAPVVIVRGNHDLAGELDVFARLRSRWPIAVSSTPEVLHIETAAWNPDSEPNASSRRRFARVFTLPYPNKAALVAAGTPPALVSQAARAALDGLMAYGAAELAAPPPAYARPACLNLVLGHGNVAGAQSSVGQPQIGNEIEFDAQMFERFGPDVYIGLSHIHKHQVVGRAVFAGSLCRLDFGELEPKGIVVATFEGAAFTGWRFEHLDVRKMFHIEGTLAPAGFEYVVTRAAGMTELPKILPAGSFAGADVRVRYTYKRSQLPQLNVALIHAEFAEARTLKIEAIPDRETDVRAPEIAAATTVAGKVEAFAARQGVPWSNDLAAALATIETQPVDHWSAAALKTIDAIGADVVRSA